MYFFLILFNFSNLSISTLFEKLTYYENLILHFEIFSIDLITNIKCLIKVDIMILIQFYYLFVMHFKSITILLVF
jgi:hypothetical protein